MRGKMGSTEGPQVANGVGAAAVLKNCQYQRAKIARCERTYGVARYCLQKADEVVSYCKIARKQLSRLQEFPSAVVVRPARAVRAKRNCMLRAMSLMILRYEDVGLLLRSKGE